MTDFDKTTKKLIEKMQQSIRYGRELQKQLGYTDTKMREIKDAIAISLWYGGL